MKEFISQIKKVIEDLENNPLLCQPVARDLAITDSLIAILSITNQVTPFDYSLNMDHSEDENFHGFSRKGK
jgi:hypothetical protein